MTLAPPAGGSATAAWDSGAAEQHSSAGDSRGAMTVSHFRLQRRLGAGAVGEVYLARDTALGRDVALKLLRPGLPEHWKRLLLEEAAAAVRLQHPAIATFYEAGEADGEGFVATEFVEGRTLRERLSQGRLDVDEALDLMDAVLAGLAHAHAVGLVHRDVKPENIVIAAAGGARLLDFGLAAPGAIRPGFGEAEAAEQPDSQRGVVAGTPGYMAPEQIRAEDVDARADLFSVAAVLHECLSGVAAFPGSTPAERMRATLEREPAPPPPEAASRVPAALWEVLGRALVKERETRPTSAGQFMADLRRARLDRRTSPPAAVAEDAAIAVCAWKNLTGQPDDNWIGRAIAESLSVALAQGRKVRLLEQGAEEPEGSEGPSVGLRLGCRYVLEGGFQRLGPRLRITARLAEAPTGQILTAVKVDGAADELFELQDQLAVQVSSALSQGAQVREEAPAPAPAASVYECYARGRELRHSMGKGNFEQAQLLFEQAIARDPQYAPALAELAAIQGMGFIFTTDRARLTAAAEYARRAIAADPRCAAAYSWLGYANWRLGDQEAAFAAEKRAAELDPHDFMPPYFGGCISCDRRRWPQAVALLQRAVRLNADWAWAWGGLSLAHFKAGNAEEAVWCANRTVEVSRGSAASASYPVAPALLGEMRRRQGRPDEGRALTLQGLAMVEATDNAYREGFRGMCLTALGRCALDMGDKSAAHVAFSQAIAQLRGRPRVLGAGHLLVQALCGQARADGDSALLAEARRHAAAGAATGKSAEFDFSWAFMAAWDATEEDLAAAAAEVGGAV